MARPIVLVKLGGSLITDKKRAGVARHAAIRRLAGEIAALAKSSKAPRLLIGHGSGSFGHAAAARGGLFPGTDATKKLDAIAETRRRASDLNRVMVAALIASGARPFAFAPSSFLHAEDGHVSGRFLEPVFTALERGLLPVIYGDVVLDASRGATVISTEALFLIVAKEAARRKRAIARVVWLGETDGVRDGDGSTIVRMTARKADKAARHVIGASGTDVTGGMALRLQAASALAKAGIASAIVDGRRPGALTKAVAGREAGGTRVDSR
jgi:isopentenyl phosphate kinase